MNDEGFVISEEDLASGPGSRLDHLSFCVAELPSDRDIRRETESAPTHKSYQGLIYFCQTHSHNRHLKLTGLELTTERSHQIHSYNIHLKITRLVRRFLLRRNMSSLRRNKIHCYID